MPNTLWTQCGRYKTDTVPEHAENCGICKEQGGWHTSVGTLETVVRQTRRITFPHVINNYLVNHILDALDSLVWFFVYLIKF